jgi:FHS family L-fucose permease-like MFS transporter
MTDQTQAAKSGGSSLGLAIIYVTTLFFIWAVVTNLLDPAIAAMKTIYDLHGLELALQTFAFFIAYGVMSMPAASFLSKKGYAASIIVGLGGIVAGCLFAYVSTLMASYPVFLLGLFVMASGITLLQVAANPLIAAMGDPKHSAFRLNLSQAFNSLGAASVLFVGSSILLKGEAFKPGVELTDALRAAALTELGSAYLKMGIILAIFIGMIFLVRKTISDNAPQTVGAVSPLSALSSKWARLGGLAIFFYVGAEVSIGASLILYIEQQHILNIATVDAGKLITWYMLFAMFGRFIGSVIMRTVKGHTVLALAALGAIVLCLIVVTYNGTAASVATGSFTMPIVNVIVPISEGTLPGMAAICVGIFNSIMFPTIFTTTLERSSAPASATSGLLCVAIVGGAFVPLLFAAVKDATSSYSLAFIVPALCYGYILWFANAAKSAPVHVIEEGVSGGH